MTHRERNFSILYVGSELRINNNISILTDEYWWLSKRSASSYPISAWVHHGSVLVPTLFHLNINGFLSIISNSTQSYADDSHANFQDLSHLPILNYTVIVRLLIYVYVKKTWKSLGMGNQNLVQVNAVMTQ